ncbi:holo-ACP synthase [Pseudomonadota bacterium]
MIHGIGTDIVSVKRMQESLDRHGEHFALRILADNEVEAFRAAASQAGFLAKRFAVKEAAVKALGTGFRDGISMKHIYVEHDGLGKPLLKVVGRARELFDEGGVGECHVTISDEREYAVAFVTLLKNT